MISFWRIFSLEFTAFVRSKTLLLLTVASVGWMIAMPYLVKGDGTPEGARELYLHYSLGGVFALLVVALVASATGTLAREREAKRLQLTMIRPVRYAAIAGAKILAHVALGALVLGLAALVMPFRVDFAAPCRHVLKPLLPSVSEEAKAMYDVYMADPETPKEVKAAKRETVLRLLESRAVDHYQTITTNATVSWRFAAAGDAVRMRFTNPMDMRQSFLGVFRAGGAETTVSNITQAILEIPFKGASAELSFENRGASAIMLRPRKDIEVLRTADALGWNLLRACLEMVAILAVVIAFATFLSAALSRPVALFVAMTVLLLGEMSPSVIEQYPDELETKLVDRVGLVLTRFAAEATRPVASLSPLAVLSKDECVEPREVARVAVTNLVLAPLLLTLLAAFVLPRKN